jgi:GntR family transcriptional repressor for pyruvate dehydrogenase complex
MEKSISFKPMVKKRLYEGVVDQIKQAIYDGQLQPGDRLPSERELCKNFNVGRPTIREALRTLDVLGMIEVSHGAKGSIVKEHDIVEYMEAVREQMSWLIRADKKTYRHLLKVRNYIDIGIAHTAADNATDEDIKRLEGFLEKLQLASNEIEEYFPLAVEFHQQLALSTKNKMFYLVGEMFRDILMKGYIPLAKEIFPNGPAKLIKANKIMLDAIKSRKHCAIDRAMEKHNQEEEVFLNHFYKEL